MLGLLILVSLESFAFAGTIAWDATPTEVLADPPGGGVCAPFDDPKIKVTCSGAAWFDFPVSTSFEFEDNQLKAVVVRYGELDDRSFSTVMGHLEQHTGASPTVQVRGTWREKTLTQWSVGPDVTVFEEVSAKGRPIHFMLVSLEKGAPEP